MTTMDSDIKVLKLGQAHISKAVDEIGSQVKQVADGMTSLIRLTEQHNALYARVDKIEKFQENRKQATDPVIQRGQTYMNLASLVGSIVVLVGGSFIAWLVGHVEAAEKDIRSHETRIAVIENRNVSTKSSR